MDGRELQQFLRFKDEAQLLRSQNQHLRHAVNACRPELYRAGQRIGLLEEQNAKLLKENQRLTQKLADLAAKFQTQARPAAPAFVKANVPEKAQRKPGRKKGASRGAAADAREDRPAHHGERADRHPGQALLSGVPQPVVRGGRAPTLCGGAGALEGAHGLLSHHQRLVSLVPQDGGVAGGESAAGGGFAPRATGPQRAWRRRR